jgi:hypothetical protein
LFDCCLTFSVNNRQSKVIHTQGGATSLVFWRIFHVQVAGENLSTTEQLEEAERARKASVKPINVCITAANSRTGYALVSRVASGDVFGCDVTLSLRLCDDDVDTLRGVAMEVADLASGVIHDTAVTSDASQFFADCDVVVLLDRVECREDESRDDWLRRVHGVFTNYAVAIEKTARPGVKVIVAGGGPAANFAGSVMCRAAPEIHGASIVVVAGVAESWARGAIASRLQVNSASIVDLVVWGDAAASTVGRFAIDVSRARMYECDARAIWGPGHSMPLAEAVHDDPWLWSELPKALVTEAQNRQSQALVSAEAVSELLNDWWHGKHSNRVHSLAVSSRGW